MAVETENTTAVVGGINDKLNNLKPVNGLMKRVNGDAFDEWKTFDGHMFTMGFLIESLRANDKEYKKLHGSRPVKDVSFTCNIAD